MAEAARRLTRRDVSRRVRRWGIKPAADPGNAQWTNTPRAIEALTYSRSPASEFHGTPDRISAWPQFSPDFLKGNAAIIQHAPGNLTNARDEAGFPFGVVGLPRAEGPRTLATMRNHGVSLPPRPSAAGAASS